MVDLEVTRSGAVVRISRSGTRWLHTGWKGGSSIADRAYSVSVPTGWSAEDIGADIRTRRRSAGFPEPGPTLITGVAARHARLARCDDVAAVVTAGLSNPARLPIDPSGEPSDPETGLTEPGTVNILVCTDRRLVEGARANLVATVAEAKTATLQATAGVTGTTTDAIALGDDPEGPPVRYSGSATPIGAAARACVRDAILAALAARYPDRSPADAADGAEHGVATTDRARVASIPPVTDRAGEDA